MVARLEGRLTRLEARSAADIAGFELLHERPVPDKQVEQRMKRCSVSLHDSWEVTGLTNHKVF